MGIETTIGSDLKNKYWNMITGRRTNPRYNPEELKFLDNYNLDQTINQYHLDPEERRLVLRMAQYEKAKDPRTGIGGNVRKISDKIHQAGKRNEAKAIQWLRGSRDDNDNLIFGAQSLGLGFPSEANLTAGLIQWNHEQQEILKTNPDLRIAFTRIIEDLMISRLAIVLADLEWLKIPRQEPENKSSSLSPADLDIIHFAPERQLRHQRISPHLYDTLSPQTDAEYLEWKNLFDIAKNQITQKYKNGLAGKEESNEDQKIPELKQQQIKNSVSLINNLAQILAALPEGSASRRISTLLKVVLGSDLLKQIQIKSQSYREQFTKSANHVKKTKSQLHAEGKDLYTKLKSENFPIEQIVDTAVDFWLKPPRMAGGDVFAYGIQALARKSKKPGPDEIEKFKTALSQYIKTNLEKGETVTLKTIDEWPDGALANIAKESEINGINFHENTEMTIYPDKHDRLAIQVNQYKPNCEVLPLSEETFFDRSIDTEKINRYKSMLGYTSLN